MDEDPSHSSEPSDRPEADSTQPEPVPPSVEDLDSKVPLSELDNVLYRDRRRASS
jgi:hypothetical protein